MPANRVQTKEKIYSPPKYLYYFFIVIFLLVLFLILINGEVNFTTISLSCFEIIIFIALIELLKSSMIVTGSEIIIKGLFKNNTIKLSDIENIKMQDHELYIFLHNDKKLDIPLWFPNQKSLYMVLKSRIKHL